MVNSILHTNTIQNIFYNLVKDYPSQSNDYNQPQTFAAIRYREQIHNASLDKTKIYNTIAANNGLFYSRTWDNASNNINDISFDFPLVFLLQQASQTSDHKRPVYRFLFGVMDLKNRDSSIDSRVDEVKINDLEVILSSVLNEALEYVYVDHNNNSNYVWRSKNNTSSEDIRSYLRTAIKNQNNLVFTPFEDWEKQRELNGIMCELVIQGELETKTYTY